MKLPPIAEKFDLGFLGFLMAHLGFFVFVPLQHWYLPIRSWIEEEEVADDDTCHHCCDTVVSLNSKNVKEQSLKIRTLLLV